MQRVQREALQQKATQQVSSAMSDAEHLRLHCNACVQPSNRLKKPQTKLPKTRHKFAASLPRRISSAAAAIAATGAGASRLVHFKTGDWQALKQARTPSAAQRGTPDGGRGA